MTEQEIKESIQKAIKEFAKKDFSESAISLFTNLGFDTQRRDPFDNKTYDEFKNRFLKDNLSFKADKALSTQWKSIDLLFQITKFELEQELPGITNGKVDNTEINSFMFFAVELSKDEYSKTTIAAITREINKVFPMPVIVLFKYGGLLTLSVINRRLNKKDEQKDVLEKVTLIKDINVKEPHRAHIEILFDLSLGQIKAKKDIKTFVQLYSAWQEILDTKELNKKFYKELSNWYFWALQEVEFPHSKELSNNEIKENNSKNLIRLLTRLLFVWFIKEKKLIPEQIFEKEYCKNKLLKDFEPFIKKKGHSVYYKAVLQNLFFAVLNQEIVKRDFRKDGQHRGIMNLLRYKSYFNNPQDFIDILNSITPFMNGGLFECLDFEIEGKTGAKGGPVFERIDGFSDEKNNTLSVPDYLFFSSDASVDLSKEYDNPKLNTASVSGLLNIFKKYKFTIAENTPIEEDIALDPELLGRVFENLLASYNPETQTTARKQTGSFYTPREIVNYMVDQSLVEYLKQKLLEQTNLSKEEAEDKLQKVIAYNEFENQFNQQQTKILIDAIDTCKILDPACGSGAFPMGILHKLVYILSKIDPQNQYWRELQKQKAIEDTQEAYDIGDKEQRKIKLNMINDIFEHNSSDYGRKLYLIENCIYGIDIQPIAIQISKLRFFISLIIDQKTNKEKDNFGIIPLPNLETKFVTANALIGLKLAQKDFGSHLIAPLEKALKDNRHDLFSARTPKQKKSLRIKDKEIRQKIADTLIKSGFPSESAKKLSKWDLSNQNDSADWFDSEWMFGVKDGVDIVLGNPPYIQLQKMKLSESERKSGVVDMQMIYQGQNFETYNSMGDIYCLFYERSMGLLKNIGYLCFITSNKWMRAGYGEDLRDYLVKYNPKILIDLGGNVFDSATVDTNILLIEKSENQGKTISAKIKDHSENMSDLVRQNGQSMKFDAGAWVILNPIEQSIKAKIEKLGTPLKDWGISINCGIKTGCTEAFIINGAKKDELIAKDAKSAEIIRPILRGRDIKRYGYEFADLWLIAAHNGYKDIPRIDINKYPAVKKHLDKYWKKIVERDDQGDTPYNLRSCAYMDDFSKQKIVWTDIATEPSFVCMTEPLFFNNTCYMMNNSP
ncbi:MAG: Eco57I restriction-modification methylase domain-containing protein, partial [Elusimicrobiota bacterium]|nr:Eco57I restriction-modification methylase domain-containing protein [Elusimicrobiota bacterium]